jgi:Arylsulfatase A and related enzymes
MCVYVTAMVSKLDESVGQIVHTLMETGMLNNSIIIFISDNGAPSVGVFQNWGSNYPLRGVRILVCYRQLTRAELLEHTVA